MTSYFFAPGLNGIPICSVNDDWSVTSPLYPHPMIKNQLPTNLLGVPSLPIGDPRSNKVPYLASGKWCMNSIWTAHIREWMALQVNRTAPKLIVTNLVFVYKAYCISLVINNISDKIHKNIINPCSVRRPHTARVKVWISSNVSGHRFCPVAGILLSVWWKNSAGRLSSNCDSQPISWSRWRVYTGGGRAEQAGEPAYQGIPLYTYNEKGNLCSAWQWKS